MLQRRATSFALIVLLLGGALGAAADEAAVLEYFDDDRELTIYDDEQFKLEFFSFGERLEEGYQVITHNSSAELRLDPNGSLIRMAPDTVLTIEHLDGEEEAVLNLDEGRLRSVARRMQGSDFEIRTPATTAGVRGTDFSLTPQELAVFEGEVEFTDRETGETLQLGAGRRADITAPTFEPIPMDPAEIEERRSEQEFRQLDPQAMPTEDPAEPEDPDDPEHPEDPDPVADPATPADPTVPEGPADPVEDPEDTLMTGVMEGLADVLAMEIGSTTIAGETYSKAILQPTFEIGRLRTALYLPIIYRHNLFDPDDWYQPRGNNEWSFGTDEKFAGEDNEWFLRAEDFLRDLLLKIRYIEFAEQRDPFFFKLGNIESMTLGHGSLMRDYANDSEFPAVRRVGFNLGLDRGSVGIETVANDLANPALFGGRLYTRPLGADTAFAVGASAVTDISPANEISAEETGESLRAAREADPLILTAAADVDISVIETDVLSIVLFGDAAGLIPMLRNETVIDGVTIERGWERDAFLERVEHADAEDELRVRNYGLMSGVFGNVAFLDYRLEFRHSNGVFRPGYFGSEYDRIRGTRAAELMDYLRDPDQARFGNTTGIYGEAGFDILNAVRFDGGYFWPWRFENGDLTYGDRDELKLKLAIREDILPLGFYGSVQYRRTEFIPTLLDRGHFTDASLFDANTVFRGEVVYPAAPILDIVGQVTTTVSRDADGSVRYDEHGRPEWSPSFTVETRIGF